MNQPAWKYRPVLVTGATGLLGAALVRELLARGAAVVALVRDSVGVSPFFSEGIYRSTVVVPGELEDFPKLLRTVNEHEIHTVFHLGAQTIVGTANRSPLSTFEANIRGTWNLLEACRLCPQLVKRIVLASSDKAYGEHPQLPYDESFPLAGRYPYDASKACAEQIARSYFQTYRLPIAITRCGNLFGPGDLNFSRLVPGTIRSLLAGERPVIRSDGTFVRDYFYVRDAATAYLDLADALQDEANYGEAFNFGTETPLSVVEMVKLMAALLGRSDLEPVIQNQATAEIPRQYLSCAKARARLGWASRWTLEAGLRETIAWYREFLS
ncbi:MAG: GDP-mannose 4,6-dehydratase [Pirellulales bacterium]|nr:GDP-mannose 4,6-dehydratase [Pirellulales bacterium]